MSIAGSVGFSSAKGWWDVFRKVWVVWRVGRDARVWNGVEGLNATGDAVDGRVEGCLSQAEAHLTIVSVPMFVVEGGR